MEYKYPIPLLLGGLNLSCPFMLFPRRIKLQVPTVVAHVAILSSTHSATFRGHPWVSVSMPRNLRHPGEKGMGPHVQAEAGLTGGPSQGQSGGLEPHPLQASLEAPQEAPTVRPPRSLA